MALNYVKGTISHFGQVESGTTQNGNSWSRQVIVVDVEGYGNSYTKIALTAQNGRVEEMQQYQIGDRVEIGYSVTAREWNGKWFNNVDLINVKSLEEYQSAPVAPAAPAAPRQVTRPVRTAPLVPPGANLDPQDGDMPF